MHTASNQHDKNKEKEEVRLIMLGIRLGPCLVVTLGK